jgi:hypothetical protein
MNGAILKRNYLVVAGLIVHAPAIFGNRDCRDHAERSAKGKNAQAA